MAINTFNELKLAVQRWMARDDLEHVDDFILLFEAFINRVLLTRPMHSDVIISDIENSAALLPLDFLSVRSVFNPWSADGAAPLQYITPEELRRRFSVADTTELTSSFYSIEGPYLYLDGGNTDIGLAYTQKVPPLSDAAPTNWLLLAHPDLYLFGTLVEGNAYVQDAQAATLWKARRDELVREMFLLEFRSGGAGAITPLGATP